MCYPLFYSSCALYFSRIDTLYQTDMNAKLLYPIRVAYADDHDMMRAGLCALLNGRKKVQVLLDTRNGLDLIRKLKLRTVLPDVIILDIFMPELDGFETLKQLRATWPGIKILVLTGHNTDYYHVKMVMAGANGYMLKDSGPSEIEAAIEAIYLTGVYHSDKANARLASALAKGEAVIPTVTDREAQFLKLCCSDMSYSQIAEAMGISISAVDWTRNQLFRKFKVQNRAGLVNCGLRYGLVPSPFTD